MHLALIGDLHFFQLRVPPWALLGKRLLGQTNLWLNRRKRLDMSLLAPLLERVEACGPEMLLSTGDLTTTALPSEFERAHQALLETFLKQPTFLVPGNHDRYTYTATRRRYLEQYFLGQTTSDWPHHRPLEPGLRLLAIDAARPTPLLSGSTLSRGQLDRLADLLAGIRRNQRLILLSHYSPATPPGFAPEVWSHRLRNADALVRVLAEAGHEILLLHGHVHRPWCWRLTEAPNVVAVNAGAPLMTGEGYPRGQGFWRIEASGAGGEAAWGLRHESIDGDGNWQSEQVAIPEKPGEVAMLGPGPWPIVGGG